MTNEMIIINMVCSGVGITELANELSLDCEEVVEKLNSEMDIYDNFEVMMAIAEIIRRKERT